MDEKLESLLGGRKENRLQLFSLLREQECTGETGSSTASTHRFWAANTWVKILPPASPQGYGEG